MPVIQTKPKVQTMIKEEQKPFQLVIIGGGPAGLTAGLYAKRFGIDCVLVEMALPGGLITTTEHIDNFPGFPDGISGMALGSKFEEQAKKFGLDIVFSKAIELNKKGDIFEISTDDAKYTAQAVIVATGSDPKKLDVKGEKEFTGKGVSYCATCDGPFYKNKVVAVVGGGNGAIEEAIYLTKFAKLVTIIHRRDSLRADKVLEEKAAANKKLFFKLNCIIDEIVGEKTVTSLKIRDVKTNKTHSISLDGLFVNVGYTPNSRIVKDIVKLDVDGSILTDDMLATDVPGIFAAGDVRKKPLKQVVTAVADGAVAANSAKNYLSTRT
jgi:thioredoxin reductase (NADPH)